MITDLQKAQKEEAWVRVRGLLLQAVSHLYTVDESPTAQELLLDLADKAKIQAGIWKKQ
jgi:hypothetical protein